jgi:nitroreductase
MTPDDLLTTTRAVRKRLDFDKNVPRPLIEECLEVALQAPNGSNLQRWRWLIVDDADLIAKLAGIYNEAIEEYSKEYRREGLAREEGESPAFDRMNESVQHLARNLHRAPALVIPCLRGRMESQAAFAQASQWGSIIPAIWSLMLAFRSRGLGSAWTTVHLHREREAADLLGIPYAAYTQAGLFPVAFTLGADFRRGPRKPAAEVIRWNRW